MVLFFMTSTHRDAILQGSASPFTLALVPHLAVLPPALAAQYLASPRSNFRVVLEGRMDKVWHHPRWLTPFFYPLAWAQMLFPEMGTDIPAMMEVAGTRDRDGVAAQTWHRTFTFPPTRRFNALMAYDVMRDCVVERMGPFHALWMAWDIMFHPPDTVEIKTTGCSLHIGKVRVQLPSHLYPFVRAVERAVPERDDQIHIDLAVSHPRLGTIFGYDGTFTLRRDPLTAVAVSYSYE